MGPNTTPQNQLVQWGLPKSYKHYLGHISSHLCLSTHSSSSGLDIWRVGWCWWNNRDLNTTPQAQDWTFGAWTNVGSITKILTLKQMQDKPFKHYIGHISTQCETLIIVLICSLLQYYIGMSMQPACPV